MQLQCSRRRYGSGNTGHLHLVRCRSIGHGRHNVERTMPCMQACGLESLAVNGWLGTVAGVNGCTARLLL